MPLITRITDRNVIPGPAQKTSEEAAARDPQRPAVISRPVAADAASAVCLAASAPWRENVSARDHERHSREAVLCEPGVAAPIATRSHPGALKCGMCNDAVWATSYLSSSRRSTLRSAATSAWTQNARTHN